MEGVLQDHLQLANNLKLVAAKGARFLEFHSNHPLLYSTRAILEQVVSFRTVRMANLAFLLACITSVIAFAEVPRSCPSKRPLINHQG